MDRYLPFLRLTFGSVQDVGDEDEKTANRVVRSFERMRRAAVKILEAFATAQIPSRPRPEYLRVKTILVKTLETLEEFVCTVSSFLIGVCPLLTVCLGASSRHVICCVRLLLCSLPHVTDHF